TGTLVPGPNMGLRQSEVGDTLDTVTDTEEGTMPTVTDGLCPVCRATRAPVAGRPCRPCEARSLAAAELLRAARDTSRARKVRSARRGGRLHTADDERAVLAMEYLAAKTRQPGWMEVVPG